MAIDEGIAILLGVIHDATGTEALSEAKVRRLSAGAPEVVTVAEGDSVVAVGVAAPHRQPDGSVHWSIETAVTPGLRFEAFEGRVLDATLAILPSGSGEPSVWSMRPSLGAALERRGFHPSRRLLHMSVDLPLDVPHGAAAGEGGGCIRPMEDDDVEAVLAINQRAFAAHREAASLGRDDIEAHRTQPWFEPPNLLIDEEPDGFGGFCWTRIHPNGDGEIYRIAVDPSFQGRGTGRRLLVAGFAELARRPEVRRGTLWVDGANEAAITLYESIGMRTDRVNVEFERPQPKR